MNYQKARQAYLNDPQYHQLIDMMLLFIEKLEFSPSELRQAAVFASMLHEERKPPNTNLIQNVGRTN